MVLSVGEHSEAGKAMKQLQKESEDTPLQEKLEGLAERIIFSYDVEIYLA
jgi:magnesium-transporting ATPase (P-type)